MSRISEKHSLVAVKIIPAVEIILVKELSSQKNGEKLQWIWWLKFFLWLFLRLILELRWIFSNDFQPPINCQIDSSFAIILTVDFGLQE